MSTYSAISDAGVQTYNVLGCRINALTANDLTDLVEDAVKSRESCIIANHNLHSLYLYQRDSKVRELFAQAKWIHADGMGIVLLGRAVGARLTRSVRVTYVDWLPLLLKRAADQNWQIFYLGSKPGVAEKGAEVLRERFPGLRLTTTHGYFDPAGEENERVLAKISDCPPDVLMIGMGMPRQEHWIVDNLGRFGPIVLLPCGAAIDYVAGEIPTPPRWAGRCGLEWFYRLGAEPGRLWKRYLVEPWFLLVLVGSRWLRSRSEPPDQYPQSPCPVLPAGTQTTGESLGTFENQ
jgi:N-acetylglucosaminyldiphosphoundecaprenol N-acetyl-beta-D-mannosaminyltransferase